jgi:O-antigen/teichoic acid export membrane protein
MKKPLSSEQIPTPRDASLTRTQCQVEMGKEDLQKHAMKSKIAKNTFINFAGSALSYLSGFIVLPFLVRKLGLEQFGLYSIVSLFSVTGFMYLLEMGFQSSVIKYTAQFHAQDNRVKLNQLASSAILIFIVLSFFSATIGYFVSPYLVGFFKVSDIYRDPLILALRITFVTHLFSFPGLIATGLVQGFQDFSLQKSLDASITLTRSLGSIALLLFGASFIDLVIFMSVLQVLQCLILFGYLMIWRKIRIHVSEFSVSLLKEIRQMTALVFIGRLCSFAFTHVDRLILSHYVGPAALGLYEAAIRLPFGIKGILSQLNIVLMPASSHISSGVESEERLSRIYVKAVDFQFFVSLPIIITFLVFAHPIMRLWLGAGTDQAATLMQIALIIPLMGPFVYVGGSMLLGTNRSLHTYTWITVVLSLVNLALDFILVPTIGTSGVLWATAGAMILLQPFNFQLFRKEFDVRLSEFSKILWTSAGITAVVVLVWRIFNVDDLASGWPQLIAGSGALWFISSLALYQWGLQESERVLISGYFEKIKRKLGRLSSSTGTNV